MGTAMVSKANPMSSKYYLNGELPFVVEKRLVHKNTVGRECSDYFEHGY